VSVTVFFHNENDWCESHVEGQIPSDARIEEIGQMIANRPEVSEVVFTSDDEAWENWRRNQWGENYDTYSKAFLENPLEGDNSYEIFLSDVSMQDTLVTYLYSIEGVRLVRYSALTASTLSGVNLLIGYVSLGIIVVLLAVSVFLISNTVTIGISVRREEINIMKYIGATDFFVRAPFVLEGMLIGLIGAAIPLWVVHYFYGSVLDYAAEKFSMLSHLLIFLPAETIFGFLTPVCLGVGVGIGFMGSISTVRKHLHV